MKTNLNKSNHRHSELVSESIRHCERSEAIWTRLPRATALAMTNETGRSMVEMLGVLAVIGVLSITGISGYTTAMNKHKANEILDNASKRAVVVAGQIQLGNTSPTLGEFDTNTVQGVTYGNPYKLGDNQFAIPLTWDTTNTLTDDLKTTLCKNMKQYISEDGEDATAQIDTNCTRIVYNNDLSAGTSSSNNTNYDSSTQKCKTGYYGADCQNECTGDHKVVKNNACVCDEDNSYYADEDDSNECVLDRCHNVTCSITGQTCNPDNGLCACINSQKVYNNTKCVDISASCGTLSSSDGPNDATGSYILVDEEVKACNCLANASLSGTTCSCNSGYTPDGDGGCKADLCANITCTSPRTCDSTTGKCVGSNPSTGTTCDGTTFKYYQDGSLAYTETCAVTCTGDKCIECTGDMCVDSTPYSCQSIHDGYYMKRYQSGPNCALGCNSDDTACKVPACTLNATRCSSDGWSVEHCTTNSENTDYEWQTLYGGCECGCKNGACVYGSYDENGNYGCHSE